MRCLFLGAMIAATLLVSPASWAQEKPFFDQKDLFINGLDGANMYRIPVLLVVPSGTILAFCEARQGDDGDPTDLVVKRSLNVPRKATSKKVNRHLKVLGNGERWERMQVIAPNAGNAMMNPCPVYDRDTGAIVLCCYKVVGGLEANLKNPHGGRALILTSTDDGASWSSVRDITASVGGFVAGPGIGIQLRTGRLVIPGYGGGASRVIYSDDHGKTWQLGAKVAAPTNESQVVELADGQLMMNMRNKGGAPLRHIAFSRDGGQTWRQEYDDAALPDSVCQASLLTIDRQAQPGRRRLLFSSPFDSVAKRRRIDMTVRLSTDEGKHWPVSRTIDRGPSAYSCMAVLVDGKVGLLYENGPKHPYENITFARFNTEWLTAGQGVQKNQ